MDSNHSTIIFVNSGNKNERVPKPARIPPQTSPAGGKSAEAGRIHSRQKYGRREAPSVLHSPHKILILQVFATLRVAPRLPMQI